MSNFTLAKLYDFLLYPFLKNIRNKTAKLIIQLNPESVIDICCGTGNQLSHLKNTNIKLTGIDLSPVMLKAANGIDCFNQDARDIQFSDSSFDLALIQLALHEKSQDDQEKIINEIHRILNSQGHLLVVDYEISKITNYFARKIINTIEFIAGKEHYNYFKLFHKNGCTNNLINSNQFKLKKKMLIAGKSMAIHIFQKY